MITTNKTTTTEKRILKRLERILPLILFSITLSNVTALRCITFYRKHDTVWNFPFTVGDSFSIPLSDFSWKEIKEFRKHVCIKLPEKEYFYAKRCKVCKGIYSKSQISQAQYENLMDNPNISFNIWGNDYTATIDSVCDGHADEYYASLKQ